MKTQTIRAQSARRFGAWGIDTATDTDNWRGLAVCRNFDPDLHFPIGTSGPALIQAEQAKSNCRRCPVADECLQWALKTGQEYGIWGGLGEEERRILRRKQQREQQQTPDVEDPASREYREAHRLCLKCGEQLPATASRDRRWCNGCQRKPAACGTPSGYFRHIKARTPTCGPCRDAANKQRRERERKRREEWLGGAA